MSNNANTFLLLPDKRVYPLSEVRCSWKIPGESRTGFLQVTGGLSSGNDPTVCGLYLPQQESFQLESFSGNPYEIAWTLPGSNAEIRATTSGGTFIWQLLWDGSVYARETAFSAGTWQNPHWPWQAVWNNNLLKIIPSAISTEDRYEWKIIRSSDQICFKNKYIQLGDDLKTDYKSSIYPVCRVGVGEIGQVWTAQNLNDIENGVYYNNSETNGELYGTLHTQSRAVSIWESSQGDYRPARLDEWETLISLAGGATYGAINLKAVDGWSSVQGVDYFGFSALPGGTTTNGGVSFTGGGTFGRFAVLNPYSASAINYIAMNSGTTGTLFTTGTNGSFSYCGSLRLVANTGNATIDGIEYPVCQIGGIWWQGENDKSTTFSTPRNDSTLNELYGPVRNFTQIQNYDSHLKSSGSTWRVPRQDEFNLLRTTIGASNGNYLKEASAWGTDYPGNNWANFNALPGGIDNYSGQLGKVMDLGSITEYPSNTSNYYVLYVPASSNTISATANVAKGTRTSVRLVKRFYRVPMPWGEVRTFVHIGGLYIDTQNLDWSGEDGSLGVYYADDSTLGAVYGRLYSKADHDTILAYLADRKIPVSTLDATQFSTLTTYNSGNASTQAKNLCDAELFSGVTNLYELSLVPNGVYTGSAFAELGFTCYLMSRAGILSFDASGLCETLDITGDQKAAIRLCYAAPESVIA